MQKGLISIITPVFNGEKYLDKAIESILNQTYKNIELLLINDGSIDNSASICQKWSEMDSRIVFIDKQNEGAAVARNKGLEQSNGEYIGFVDQDDIIEPTMYETMLKQMTEKNADIVMCNSESFDENGPIKQTYTNYENFEIDNIELTNRMLSYEKIFCSSVWSKLYKREIIGNQRFDEEIFLGDDYCFNGHIYPSIKQMYYNNNVLYHYRNESGSMTRSEIGKHFFDKYSVAVKLEKDLKKYEFIEPQKLLLFKISVTYEILFVLCQKKADPNIINQWRLKLKEQYKHIVKVRKMKKKNRIKLIMMSNFPGMYVHFLNKRRTQ